MSELATSPHYPVFCSSSDLSCIMKAPLLCQEALKAHFSGEVSQKIFQLFEDIFPQGFCSLPYLNWQPKFMFQKEPWSGALIGIESQDLSASLMRGLTAKPHRLFIVTQTNNKTITTLFQQALSDNWHMGTPSLKNYLQPSKEPFVIGPFDTIPPKNNEPPLCTLENTCLEILKDLAEKRWTVTSTTYLFQNESYTKTFNFSLLEP